ncbi:hypothetical protein BDA99DRAFT_523096 [Phascolomyces articulosus]|uniref:Uncharacterized protein n=1 Tax=Phascolomyces articulosus TaxID=60185 RepID=A0AAD5PB06_9FUNG|nr:hypothetical protein BDA99DRAFT_523096 [Phascolomyces articulosus]
MFLGQRESILKICILSVSLLKVTYFFVTIQFGRYAEATVIMSQVFSSLVLLLIPPLDSPTMAQ